MIVIDMDMPKSCYSCPITCIKFYPHDVTDGSRPDFCPIKCDIDDIKVEINDEMNFCAKTSKYTRSGFDTALNIIDKHTQ